MFDGTLWCDTVAETEREVSYIAGGGHDGNDVEEFEGDVGETMREKTREDVLWEEERTSARARGDDWS